MMKLLAVFLLIVGHISAISIEKLNEIAGSSSNPFKHDLSLTVLPGSENEVMVAMHGMGSSSTVGEVLRANQAIPFHIVSFNFPDYNFRGTTTPSFGTIAELLPALYVLKQVIVEGKLNKIHLYGFSAGGGAIINALAVLNSGRFEKELQQIGIGPAEKKQILATIEKGSIILEVPLKSFNEIADLYGDSSVVALANTARKNGLVPIDNIDQLQGLKLNIFVYFATPDEGLGNRDDSKFIERLRKVNTGQTHVILGPTKGHTSYHPELWDAYKKFFN